MNRIIFTLLVASLSVISNNSFAQLSTSSVESKFSKYEFRTVKKIKQQTTTKSDRQSTVRLNLGSYGKFDLVLYKTDLLSPDYKLYASTERGTRRLQLRPPTTYRGFVKNSNNSTVSLTQNGDFLYGFVQVDNKEIYFEPASSFTGNPDDTNIIVYDKKHVNEKNNKTCAAVKMEGHVDHNTNKGSTKAGDCFTVEIAIANDFSMYQQYGNAQGVQNHAIGVLNNVQTNYDDEFADELNFSLVEQFVSNCSTCDPWTSNVGSGDILNSFTNWGPTGFNAAHDVATLWTRRNLDNGSTVGIAWLSAICTSARYNVCQDFTTSATFKRVLLAHELGHNFSAQHDASGASTIMAPAVQNTSTWSPASINSFQAFYPTRTCLANDCGTNPGPSCNDNTQNGDEEGVDCGGTFCAPCTTPPTCNDNVQNGDEEGVDCGGTSCAPCSNPSDYCDVTAARSDFEYIKRVTLSNINNITGSDNGYGNYTNVMVNISAGQSYTLGLQPGFFSTSYNEYWKVWIDYNGDNDFDDNGELVYQGAGSGQLGGQINVPASTPDVMTRMRVSMQWNEYPANSCTGFSYGEIEDYGINIATNNPPAPTCDDNIQNGDEEGVDCGGSFCAPCTEPPTCDDNIQNGDEEGVDCGGSFCAPCTTPPTCDDNIQNGDEDGVDCGGSFCVPCTTPPTCDDNIQNGDEDGIDCGGSFCVPCATDDLKMDKGVISNVGESWTSVSLNNSYNSMVVVATVQYKSTAAAPAVVRVRNTSGSSFQMKLQSPGSQLNGPYDVHYIAVEEGVYNVADHGIKMEAFKHTSTKTSGRNNWKFEVSSYGQSYSAPVVLGQVMTYNDSGWSSFWSSRNNRKYNAPNASDITVGKNVAEDSDKTRTNEVLGVMVFETGSGSLNGDFYEVKLGADNVKGTGNTNSGYKYTFSNVSNPSEVIATMSGMDGGNGGWGVLYGSGALENNGIRVAIDEDIIRDGERRHNTEQIAYLAFGSGNSPLVEQSENIVYTADWKVYPNPMQNYFFVEDSNGTLEEVEVYSIDGKLLFQESLNAETKTRIETHDLETGTYILKAIDADQNAFFKKLVVIK